MKSPLLFLIAATLVLGVSRLPGGRSETGGSSAAAVEKNVSPDEAEKLLKENPKIVVLDVRTADEFKTGHIPGAKNLDIFAPDFAEATGGAG